MGTRIGYGLLSDGGPFRMLHVFARGAWSLGIVLFLLGMVRRENWPGAVKVVAECLFTR